MKSDPDPRVRVGQYLGEGRRRALEEAHGADFAAAYTAGYEAAYATGYEEGVGAGKSEVLEVVRRYVRQLARQKIGAVPVALEQVIRGLDDVCALADLVAGIAGMDEPAELDALLARLASVARAGRPRPMSLLEGYQYQSTFVRAFIAEGRSQEFADIRRAAIEYARRRAPDVDSILFERIEQVDGIPSLVELIAALGAAQTRQAVEAVLEALPRFT